LASAACPLRQTFSNGVLMRSAERGEDEFASIGLARRDDHARATLVHSANAIQIAEVQSRVDAVHVKIQRYGDDIQVAGPLAVAEKRAFDAVGARQQAEFGGG